jgi:Nuclear cap-binding protein subunit 3
MTNVVVTHEYNDRESSLGASKKKVMVPKRKKKKKKKMNDETEKIVEPKPIVANLASKETEEERRRRVRAERFGTKYRPTPATLKFRFKDEPTIYRNKSGGFSCEGFEDAESAAAKRAERAQRFNIEEKKEQDLIAREKHALEAQARRAEIEQKVAEKETRAQRFGIDVVLGESEQMLRKEERARRFGIVGERKEKAIVNQFRQAKPVEWPDSVARQERVLHLYGTGTMKNRDVFVYFQEFGPDSVTWLHDDAVNVIFVDAFSARRALDALAVEHFPGVDMMTESKDEAEQEDVKEEQGNDDDDNENVNVGARFWRALPHGNTQLIIRYATVHDVKEKMAPLKQKRSNWTRQGAAWKRKPMKKSAHRRNADVRRQMRNQFNQNTARKLK